MMCSMKVGRISGIALYIQALSLYRVVQKKGTVLLSISLAWPAVAGCSWAETFSQLSFITFGLPSTWPQLGPPEIWLYKRVDLISVGLGLTGGMHCSYKAVAWAAAKCYCASLRKDSVVWKDCGARSLWIHRNDDDHERRGGCDTKVRQKGHCHLRHSDGSETVIIVQVAFSSL